MHCGSMPRGRPGRRDLHCDALWHTVMHWGVHRIGGIGRVGVLATLELGGCPVLMHRRSIVIIAIIVIHHHLHLL